MHRYDLTLMDMMDFKRIIFIFVLMKCFDIGESDPCKNPLPLPNADLRFVHNIYDPSDNAVNDRYLIAGWYRGGNDDMPVTMPNFTSCGTKYPIWLNGTIPPISQNEVSRTACVVLGGMGCVKAYSIKVKNCDHYRVYYLLPTTGSDEGYCFGIGEPGKKPGSIQNAEVKVGTAFKGQLKVFSAYCTFEKIKSPTELFYQVKWYINGMHHTTMEPQLFDDLSPFLLDETNLKTLGKYVSCSVRARETQKGPLGLSVKSAEKYFGIEVLTPYVVIQRGYNASIRLQPTVPIGCVYGDCSLLVAMHTNQTDDCHPITTIGQTNCGAKIHSVNYTNVIEIHLAVLEEDGHDAYNDLVEVILRTDNHIPHSIWSDYTLPSRIKIRVQDSSELDTSACEARNDPHMVTFDGRPYDIQYTGDFVMYSHTTYPIQVQSRFGSCNSNGRFPFCVFGVAVQAGRNVFVIDSNQYANFKVCNDSTLEVRRINTKKYQIYTPIGSRIDVAINSPMITVHIYPSVRDKGNTEGLCGTLTNDCTDDFKMSNGAMFVNSDTKKQCSTLGKRDYPFKPKTFSDSWLVTDGSGFINLFDPSLDENKLSPWIQSKRRCKCNKTGNLVDCSFSMVSSCPRNKRTKKIVKCQIYNSSGASRQKRSLKTIRADKDLYHQRRKKSAPTTLVQMTEREAEAYCQSSLGNSKLFKLCGDVPNVNTDHSIQACVMDIMLSNTTEWTDSSRESLQDRCLSELQLNTTLEQNGTTGHPSIAAAIREIACPGNCTDSGTCINGICECQDGFGGIDCSIDLSIPPYFEEILDNGMCDKQAWDCDVAMATGDEFIAEGYLRCKMEPFWYDTNGKVYTEKEEVVTADIQTFMNLFCPITLTRRKRDTSGQPVDNQIFVEAYNVSLSNDGIHFGDLHTLFIYDSKCQTSQFSGGKQLFLLKEGYCFIDNKCTDEYDLNPVDVCQMCNPTVSTYTWSTRTNMAGCVPVVPDDESNHLWVIGPVAGVIVGLAVIGVVVWRIKLSKKKKVSDSTLFSDTTKAEHRN